MTEHDIAFLYSFLATFVLLAVVLFTTTLRLSHHLIEWISDFKPEPRPVAA